MGVSFEAAHHDRRETGGQIGPARVQWCGGLLESGDGGGQVTVAFERRGAGQGLVEDRAQRVDVGPPVDGLAAYLFRREVLGRAHHDAGGGAITGVGRGDAEVGQFRLALGGEQDVGRFHVAVHESPAVERRQRVGDRRARRRDRQGVHRAEVESSAQIAAVHPLEHDGGRRAGEGVVDGDEAGMGDRRRGAGLLSEPRAQLVVGQMGVQDLHRHAAVEELVVGGPDGGRRAGGAAFDQAVAIAETIALDGMFHPRERSCSGAIRSGG